MDQYYIVDPDPAGDCGGPESIKDATVHPAAFSRLHFRFDYWTGDVLVDGYPCYIVTLEAKKAIEAAQLTGASFDQATISKTRLFHDLHPGWRLPKFVWLRPGHRPGVDDFGVIPNGQLVLSARAIQILRWLGLNYADIEPYESHTS